MLKKRIVSLLIAAAAGALMFLGINLISSPAMAEGSIREGLLYEATGVCPDTDVLRLEDNSASADLYAFWLGSTCSQLDQLLRQYTGEGLDLSGTLPSGTSVLDYVKNDAIRTVTQQLVLENMAKKYGVALTEENRNALARQHEQYVEALGSEDAYRAELNKLGLREETYERILSSDYLYTGLYDLFSTPGSSLAPTEDDLVALAAEEGFISADHILIMTVDPATGQPLDDETVAQKRATAEDLLAQLRASDDPVTLFSALADEYSEDTGRAANPDGYTFNENSGFVTEFTDAAYALAEGEISDIVESMYGYHILLRKPLDRTDAVQIAQPDYFDHYFMGAVDEAKVVTSDALEKIDVSALYAALTAAQSAQQTD
ncbi:MAG: peptidylprolyl isomerase [Oscillospiraceae bacterium]|nr:peptidylprolyl isomerase [Oscillospiraceae bacterium]